MIDITRGSVTVRIKADHPLKNFKQYQVLDSHETTALRKMVDTYYYEVPEERVMEARILGGIPCE